MRRQPDGRFVSTATLTEDQQIFELYDQGYGVQRIGERIGRSGEFVWRRLKAMGVKLRKPGGGHSGHFRIPHDVMDRTITLYRAGCSLAEVARETGVAPDTVKFRLRQFGVERRSLSEAQRLAHQKRRLARRAA